MIRISNKTFQKNVIEFEGNVCSSRTNLGLLQNLKKLQLCKRGIEFND